MMILRSRYLYRIVPPLAAGMLLIAFATAVGGERRVVGLNELEIYEAGAREDGVPEIEFDDTENGTEVKIRPAVHVHRYYYNGDKQYQAPFGHGGPTIVVANHPRSGKRMYVDVNLPPGAPRISYSKYRITYTYPERRVIISFSRFRSDKVTLYYRAGRPIGPKTAKDKTPHKLHATLKNAFESRKKLVVGAAATAGQLAGTVVEKANEAFDNLPVVKVLQSAADRIKESSQIEKLRQAGLKRADEATEFIRTNR